MNDIDSVRIAWANRETIQYEGHDGKWVDWTDIHRVEFRTANNWRIKPKLCKLAGIEFPMPVKWEDRQSGDWTLHASLDADAYIAMQYHNVDAFKLQYEFGIVQRTKEGAEAQLKAMQAALKQAVEKAD